VKCKRSSSHHFTSWYRCATMGKGGPIAKRKKVLLMVKHKLGSALKDAMRKSAGRTTDHTSTKVEKSTMDKIPPAQRAGYPLVPTDVKPEHWKTKSVGDPVKVDFCRANWLPDDWGQGIKATHRIARSTDTTGGMLTCFVSPKGDVYFHKHMVEKWVGRKLTAADGFNGQKRLAFLQGQQAQGACGKDDAFFKILSPSERAKLPNVSDIHFCVVSARRADKPEGLKDIATTQALLKCGGAEATWYVDAESLADYKKLGLKAVIGGKLTPSRNKALEDARKQGKYCVQLSDDIGWYEYMHGKTAVEKGDDACNAAYAAATRFSVSPVAAARFLIAKMRGATTAKCGPKLAGVFPLASCARSFGGAPESRKNFVLGDFFVVDPSSTLKFDPNMNLKEDYDFTAAHISKYGSVMRCNRMTVHAKHYSNSGGACTNRDSKGKEERRNIDILFRKWPGFFRNHPTRKNEVVLQVSSNTLDKDDEDLAIDSGDQCPKNQKAAGRTQPTTLGKSMKTVRKTGLKAVQSSAGLPSAKATLRHTGKTPLAANIAQRCKKVAGMQVGKALGCTIAGTTYKSKDLKYDLMRGFLAAK